MSSQRQSLPGYRLSVERSGGREWLLFRPDADSTLETRSSDLSTASVEEPVDSVWTGSVDHPHDPRWIARRSIGGSPAPTGREATPSNGFGTP